MGSRKRLERAGADACSRHGAIDWMTYARWAGGIMVEAVHRGNRKSFDLERRFQADRGYLNRTYTR